MKNLNELEEESKEKLNELGFSYLEMIKYNGSRRERVNFEAGRLSMIKEIRRGNVKFSKETMRKILRKVLGGPLPLNVENFLDTAYGDNNDD